MWFIVRQVKLHNIIFDTQHRAIGMDKIGLNILMSQYWNATKHTHSIIILTKMLYALIDENVTCFVM